MNSTYKSSHFRKFEPEDDKTVCIEPSQGIDVEINTVGFNTKERIRTYSDDAGYYVISGKSSEVLTQFVDDFSKSSKLMPSRCSNNQFEVIVTCDSRINSSTVISDDKTKTRFTISAGSVFLDGFQQILQKIDDGYT